MPPHTLPAQPSPPLLRDAGVAFLAAMVRFLASWEGSAEALSIVCKRSSCPPSIAQIRLTEEEPLSLGSLCSTCDSLGVPEDCILLGSTSPTSALVRTIAYVDGAESGDTGAPPTPPPSSPHRAFKPLVVLTVHDSLCMMLHATLPPIARSLDVCRTLTEMFDAFLAFIVRERPGSSTPLSALPAITPETLRLCILDWNCTAHSVPRATIFQRLVSTAEQFPDVEAVCHVDERGQVRRASYAQLLCAASRVTRLLSAAGTHPGDFVAVQVEKGPELVACAAGIGLYGCVFLGLEASHPASRRAALLESTKARVCFISDGDMNSASELAPAIQGNLTIFSPIGPWLFDNDELSTASLDTPAETAAAGTRAGAGEESWARSWKGTGVGSADAWGDLAYTVFTSGTTGRPKGVLYPQSGLACVSADAAHRLRLGPGERVFSAALPIFDVFMFDLGACFVSGATLCSGSRFAVLGELEVTLRACETTVVSGTSSLLGMLSVEHAPPSLRCILQAGEAMQERLISTWRAAGVRVVNGYGPSENQFSTYEECDGTQPADSIGRPGWNVQCYVVDQALNAVPPGVAGELCLSGALLACGYQPTGDSPDRKEDTAFLENVFADRLRAWGVDAPCQRMYRTGDVVVQTWEGRLRFIGRRDAQVKVRGHRVDLSELEAALACVEGVMNSCAVCVRTRADTPPHAAVELVAHVETSSISAEDIRGVLLRTLPEYMVPSRIQAWARLPLTTSGKVDRQALVRASENASLQLSSTTSKGDLARHDATARRDSPADVLDLSPRGRGSSLRTTAAAAAAAERAVERAWENVLGQPPDSDGRSDFFESGGNSLHAMEFVRMLKISGIRLHVADVFVLRTFANLGRRAACALEGAEEKPCLQAGETPQMRPRAQNSNSQAETPTPVDNLGAYSGEKLPVSQRQLSVWLAMQHSLASATYNASGALLVESRARINVDRLRAATEELCLRHPILLVHPVLDAGEVLQSVRVPEFSSLVLSLEYPAADKASLYAEAERHVRRPYAPTEGLFGIVALRGRDTDVVVIRAHHFVLDGVSIDICIADLTALYNLQTHDICSSPGLPSSSRNREMHHSYHYFDFVLDEAAYLRSSDAVSDRAFWLSHLAGSPLPTFTPAQSHELRTRSKGDYFAGDCLAGDCLAGDCLAGDCLAGDSLAVTASYTRHIPIDGLPLERLNLFALCALRCCMYLASGQTDGFIGTVFHGRSEPKWWGTVGHFANVMPLRLPLLDGGCTSLGCLLSDVEGSWERAKPHFRYPFLSLVEDLDLGSGVPRVTRGRNPIFQVMYDFLVDGTGGCSAEASRALQSTAALRLVPTGIGWTSAGPEFDISLIVDATGTTAVAAAHLTFREDSFCPRAATELADSFVAVLKALMSLDNDAAAGCPISSFADAGHELPAALSASEAAPSSDAQEVEISLDREDGRPLQARGPVERAWAEVLGCAGGRDDDFFACGGNSLRALEFVRVLCSLTGLKLHVAEIYALRTLAALSLRIDEGLLKLSTSPLSP